MAASAIVVGIGSYPKFGKDGASPNDLHGAVEDAKAVTKWLLEVAKAEVTLITSDGFNGKAWTFDHILPIRPIGADLNAAFDPFAKSNAPAMGDRLYVYVAGHGLAPNPRTRCLITAEAQLPLVPNLEVPAWIDWFTTQTRFDELVLWMDCCGTQALDYTPTKPTGLANVASRAGQPARVFMAFASGFGRDSYEGPIGPGGEMRGLFTARLLKGLEGGAADDNGEVRSALLANFLRNGSLNAAGGEAQFAMVPHEDDMVFAANQPHPIYRIRVQVADGTDMLLTSPPGPLSKAAKVKDGWVSFALGVGLYKLKGGGLERIFEIGATTPADIE
ncbi:caspase family protein [Bradyrhizobium sp. WSM1743]|uniref:caspase family protein n=1 Tax=Bradyrhizobium sp. WSM1743 TaxID=318996 RepID=UPI00042774EB|nr:caspase family protein [Bradyrhizobium sp. WSM1743]